MSRTACIACVLLLGLVAGLSVAGCSRPGSDLTEEQKRGLEVLDRVANSDGLQERLSVAQLAIVERSLTAINEDRDTSDLSAASKGFDAEIERRKAAAGGKVTKELVEWAEAEAAKSDAELIATWGKRPATKE